MNIFQPTKADGEGAAEPNKREEQMWRAVLLVLLGLYILAFCIINFIGFGDFVFADMYSDSLLARYMWEQKSLFPENWVFGNQYYVIATPAVAALFYGLTGSMNLSMALATTVETAALLAAIYWLFRSFMGRTVALAGVVAMVSAVPTVGLELQSEAQILFVLCSYYSCYLLTAVVVWGDYLQGLYQGKKLLCASFFLSLIFSFATGMQSIRQTCVMIIPLLALEGLRLLISLIRKQPVNWRVTLRALCVTAANLGGVLFIHLLAVPSNPIYGSASLIQPEELPERFRLLSTAAKGITWLAYIDNYVGKYKLFLFIFCLVSITSVLLALSVSAVRLWKRHVGALDSLLWLCLISLLAVCASLLLLRISTRSLYLFMWYLMICLSATVLVGWARKNWRRLALVLLCTFSLAGLYFGCLPNVYSSITPGAPNYRNDYIKIAEELADQDYEILYGGTTITSIVCWYTDGQVVASPWDSGIFQSLNYLYPQDLISPEDNQRAAYLIFGAAELEVAEAYAAEQGAELTLIRRFELSTGDFIGLYTSSKQLMRPVETTK